MWICLHALVVAYVHLASRTDVEESHDRMLEKLDRNPELVRNVNSTLKRIESRGKSWHINCVPSDDVTDSKIVEEIDIVHNIEASVKSSLPIPDDTHVQ